MARKLLAVLGLLVLIGMTAAADSKQATLRWHGQSFFSLETSSGTKIVFDPHAIEAYGRQIVKGDIICVSHYHNDHTQIGVVEAKKPELLVGLKGTPKKAEWNMIDSKVKDVRIRTVGTFHDDVMGMERGKNSIFIVEADGMRFVHLGDLGHLLTKEQVEQIGEVDVLMIPVGGIYTINGSEARKVVAQLKPKKYILPMHYGTRVFEDVLSPDEFLDGFKKQNIRNLENTNKLVVESGFTTPEPVVVMLGWK